MELVNNNNNMFTDLTEEETNALNGGRICITRIVRVLVRRGWFFYYVLRAVRYCY